MACALYYIRRWVGPLSAAMLLLVFQAKDGRSQSVDIKTLDIEVGEPIGDVFSRSTQKSEFRIPLDMQSVDVPGDLGRREGLQITLRNGMGKSMTFPRQTKGGVIRMYVGVTDELDLAFFGFDNRLSAGRTDVSADPNEVDIAAIVETYEQVLSLAERPRAQSHCYHNQLHLMQGPCPRVVMLTARQSSEALAATLRAYHAEVAAEDWESVKGDQALVLNLGQWWFPNGNLAMMQVMPEYDVATGMVGGKMPFRLRLQVNIKDYFNSAMIRLALTCYDQQAIFPGKVSYSQAQAAHIFHGLYADFFPPVVDGVAVTDKIALASLDWGPLRERYSSDPATRKHFCDLLQRLERDVGYQGPFAPRQ